VPYLTGSNYANLGSNVFWIWGGFCWIAVAFVYTLIYETKNLSLEQVQELYENCGKAWKSKDYRVRQRRFSIEAPAGKNEKWDADDAEADFKNA
jgi:MFS transporter, SP family, sugar:H+ symporter